MINVKVSLWPHGVRSKASTLGEIQIANVGGTVDVGDYAVRLFTWGDRPRVWKKGEVRGFPRLKLGPYDLLLRALIGVVGGRWRGVPYPEDWESLGPVLSDLESREQAITQLREAASLAGEMPNAESLASLREAVAALEAIDAQMGASPPRRER